MMFDITKELESCVKCPWGCTEFCQNVELLPTRDSVKYNDNANNRTCNLSRLYAARPDYMP
eukprot:13575305-Ditylum_brightwellii.AAC.1